MIFFTSSINQNYLKLEEALLLNDPNAQISVEAMIGAVSSAGGIVAFMKKIAAGANIAGIDRKKLGELWNQKTGGKTEHRKEIKDLFRGAASGKHEWIPTDLMLEIIDRDMASLRIGEIPKWIDLQHKFRIPSEEIVFSPNKSKVANFNGSSYSVFQGHVGALYLEETTINQRTGRSAITHTEQTTNQMAFHNDLRDNFRTTSTIATVLDEIRKTVISWIWDGKQIPSLPIHPMMRWKNAGNFLDVSKNPGLSSFKSKYLTIYTKIMNSTKVI
jgi:hypothetical protein